MLFLFIDGISADSDLMFLLGFSFGVKAEGTVSLISLRQDRLNSIVCNNDMRIWCNNMKKTVTSCIDGLLNKSWVLALKSGNPVACYAEGTARTSRGRSGANQGL